MLIPFPGPGGTPAHVLVEFNRHKTSGGWRVVRCDDKRALGWITRGRQARCWNVHVYKSAFRGEGNSGAQVVPDELAPTLHGEHPRSEAVRLLVEWLARHHAPVLGFGPHPRVVPRVRLV